MKKVLFLLSLVMTLFITSCSSDNKDEPTPEPSNGEVTLTLNGKKVNFNIHTAEYISSKTELRIVLYNQKEDIRITVVSPKSPNKLVVGDDINELSPTFGHYMLLKGIKYYMNGTNSHGGSRYGIVVDENNVSKNSITIRFDDILFYGENTDEIYICGSVKVIYKVE